jgi:hypothetical protein
VAAAVLEAGSRVHSAACARVCDLSGELLLQQCAAMHVLTLLVIARDHNDSHE